MTWTHNGIPVLELPESCVGFVYVITNRLSNRKYIGKKLAKFAVTKYRMITLKNGSKKKKAIRTKVDSDWQEYWGSSKELLVDIAHIGQEHFRREILYYCKSKAECSYVEAREQFTRRVLESTDYYNGQISIRVHGSHVLGKF